MEDKLIIQKEPAPVTGWKPITVSVEHYEAIKAIADTAHLPISKVGGMLIEFALERVEVQP